MSPDLSAIGTRATPQWIANYLSQTHTTKPGGKMPDIFHGSAAQPKAQAIQFLSHFLTSLGGPMPAPQKGGSEALVESGKKLFHSVGCAACHSPETQEAILTPVIPLPDLSAKTTVDALSQFLLNPTQTHPSGRMPDLHLTPNEARAIATYLLRDQLKPAGSPAHLPTQPGITAEFYEIPNLSQMPDFNALSPKETSVVESFSIDVPGRERQDGFAIRFRSSIQISQPGNYRFWVSSDDGSRLFIDGNLIVDNDGIHPDQEKNGRIQLNQGSHELEVQYFESSGQESFNVQWAGPGIRKGQIPLNVLTSSDIQPMIPSTWSENFQPDPNAAQMGARMFAAMRCVNCHSLPGIQPFSPAPEFASLNPDNAAGCIGTNLSRRAPDYRLSESQRLDMSAAVRALQKNDAPLTPQQVVNKSLASLNCYACHKRGESGGPDDARRNFFTTTSEIDLGDEGSIPPTLNWMGAKFKPAALRRILTQGELHVRHYMATRMPIFHQSAVEPLLQAIHQVDQLDNNDSEPAFSKERVEIGQKFVGVTGVACITCHGIAGQNGIGINGIDLSTAYSRLQPGWFQKFLLAPAAFNTATRMPNFWPDGQSAFPNILGGDSSAQIQSIWTYLSLGNTMPLPVGIIPKGGVAMEIIPNQKPIVHRTFMEGVSPRTILTGFPEKLHSAFDANQVRLAKLWRGRFFDASGVASGRTDRFLSPLGTDVLDLPAGPAIASLESIESDWPLPADISSRNLGGTFMGYRIDHSGTPIFQYQLGSWIIEESVTPQLEAGGPSAIRSFSISGTSPNAPDLYLLAAEGQSISQSNGKYSVDSKIQVEIETPAPNIIIRKSNSKSQILVRIHSPENVSYKLKW